MPAAAGACGRLSELLALLADHGVAGPVLIDLGVRRDWPYYSGIVFEAYAPGVGAPVARAGATTGWASASAGRVPPWASPSRSTCSTAP